MPKPLPSYPYSPNRKVYIKEITFDGLDEKDKRWLLKRCDLKEDSEISLRRIEEATAILCSNLEYSSATYNLPEAPGGGYNLHFLLSKKYENKLNVGIRFDSEETASLLINVTSNFRGTHYAVTDRTIGQTLCRPHRLWIRTGSIEEHRTGIYVPIQ